MTKINLTKKSQSSHEDFETKVSENVTIEVSSDVKDGKRTVEGTIHVGEKENVGRFVMSESQGRLFVNMPTDNIDRKEVRGIVAAISDIILQIIPEEE